MDLSANTSLAGIAEAVASVLAAASRAGCQVYVAGALARDLWLEFGHGIATGRRTADIDFAVQCADWATFDRLAQELVGMALRRNDRVQHRFRHSNGTEIDLILISEHYLDVREPRLPIEDEEAILLRNEFVTGNASAELLGRDMAALASEDVRAFISPILDRECDPEGPLNLAQSRSGTDPLAHLGLVSALRSGFLLAT